jgi:hypothetical protein
MRVYRVCIQHTVHCSTLLLGAEALYIKTANQKKDKLRPAFKLLDAMEFAVGIDAFLLHLALREETDQRPFRNGSIDQCNILLVAVNRVIESNRMENPSYWIKASNVHHSKDNRNYISTASAYSCAVACIDSYDFLLDDISKYSILGGAARRVHCNSSIVCYYASVIDLKFKFS